MGRVFAWVHRHRGLVAFGAGATFVLAAIALVLYFVVLDQRRSARVLAATVTQVLGREVHIDRITALGPSRVVMRGVRLPAGKDWPAEVAAESVEASGPLLSAAQGGPAPVRILVTRPTVTPAPGASAGPGGSAIEAVRQGLGALLASSAQIDLVLTDGVLASPGGGSDPVAFDVVLRKDAAETRAEVILRGGGGPPLTLRLEARGEGDRVRLTLDGQGGLGPVGAWLPVGVVRAVGSGPARLQLVLTVEPGDRLAGQASLRLGDRGALDLDVAMREGLVSVSQARGSVDLDLVWSAASLAGRPRGRVELAEGEISWKPGGEAWPGARGTVQIPEAVLPAALAGTEVRLREAEARLVVEPTTGGVAVRGPLRAGRIEARGIDAAPVEAQLRLAAGPDGAVGRVELDGLAARVQGAAMRGQLAYEVARGRMDGRLEAETLPLDTLLRRIQPGWIAQTDRLRTGPARIVLSGVEVPGLAGGQVEASFQALSLERPDGGVQIAAAKVRATLREAGISARLDVDRVKGTLPALEGTVPRLDGTAELIRGTGGLDLRRASLAARDAEGRELVLAELAGRGTAGVAVTATIPALERLAGLWPSLPRTVVGSATLTLDARDASLAAFDGRLALRVPEAEVLGGKISVRDLVADLPIRRGAGGLSGQAPPGPLQVSELIGYGVVLHDVAGRVRAVDDRLALVDLAYTIYSGRGQGGGELGFGPDGLFASLVVSGERVRIEEFIASYGIRGGTMTGLLRYDLNMRYRARRLAVDGRMSVPEGGTITIELLDRLFQYTASDPSGVARRALSNLRAFDYKSADFSVRPGPTDLHVSLSLRGRERFGIFPPPVKEINVHDMPLGFLARQFPGQ